MKLPKDYSDEALIEILKSLHIRLGKSPTGMNLRENRDLPQEGQYLRAFGSWNNALALAGLKPNRVHRFTKSDLISILQREAKLLGSVPKASHFSGSKSLPSQSRFRDHFGSYANAVEAANLALPIVYIAKDKNKVIEGIRALHRELKRNPTTKDIDSCSYLPSYSSLKKFFPTIGDLYEAANLPQTNNKIVWLKWEKTCEKIAQCLYGNIIRQNSKIFKGRPDIYIPHEKLVVDATTRGYKIKRKSNQISNYIKDGTRLEFWCIAKHEEYVDPGLKYVYIDELIDRLRNKKKFYWAKRLLDFNLESGEFYTKQDVIRAIKRMAKLKRRKPYAADFSKGNPFFLSKDTFRIHFPDFNSALVASGFGQRKFGSENKYTKKSIIKKLQDLKVKLGRHPTAIDIRTEKDCPNPPTIKRYFGSFNNGLKAAGLKKSLVTYYSDEDLIAFVKKLAKKTGKTPMLGDLKKYEGMPSKSVYGARFGSWKKVIKMANLPPVDYKFYEDIFLIQRLISIAEKIKRSPRARDLELFDGPSAQVYKNQFGSLINALNATGLQPDKRQLMHL
jgi:hypothetical protein